MCIADTWLLLLLIIEDLFLVFSVAFIKYYFPETTVGDISTLLGEKE